MHAIFTVPIVTIIYYFQRPSSLLPWGFITFFPKQELRVIMISYIFFSLYEQIVYFSTMYRVSFTNVRSAIFHLCFRRTTH